jgi:hypothetical protein
LASGRSGQEARAEEPAGQNKYRVVLGDQVCPRCQKSFTASYWAEQVLVQARCLSCDLKWPRPDVV